MSQNITLPGGIILQLPGAPGGAIPAIPTIPSLPQSGDISSILAALLPLLQPLLTSAGGAANPLLGIAISALFAIGKAIHDQKQSQPPGTNKSLDELEATFWSHVTAFFPHPQPTQPTAG